MRTLKGYTYEVLINTLEKQQAAWDQIKKKDAAKEKVAADQESLERQKEAFQKLRLEAVTKAEEGLSQEDKQLLEAEFTASHKDNVILQSATRKKAMWQGFLGKKLLEPHKQDFEKHLEHLGFNTSPDQL